ncbi:hypothetical protein K1T34_37445 [Amycolatopsis sp. DSM 110486]|nr:hypothetical protein K1T34_37445 [Amycolatopsis sp. DSM 110486]
METIHASLRHRRRRLGHRLPRWVWALLRRPAPAGEVPVPARPEAHEKGLRVAWFAGTAAMAFFLFVETHYAYAPPNDPMPVPVELMIIVILSPLVGGVVLGGGGYVLGLLLVEGFVVTTLGQLKTSEGLESRLKWIGLVIFVFGFSLDLLSS